MDINCTDNCFYQHDGKCTLASPPPVTAWGSGGVNGVLGASAYYQGNGGGSDCPYCRSNGFVS